MSEHPITIDGIQAHVNVFAETQVDTFSLCTNTKTVDFIGEYCEALGSRVENPDPDRSTTEAFIYNIRNLHSQGLDGNKILLDRAKEIGLQTLMTFRLNDTQCTIDAYEGPGIRLLRELGAEETLAGLNKVHVCTRPPAWSLHTSTTAQVPMYATFMPTRPCEVTLWLGNDIGHAPATLQATLKVAAYNWHQPVQINCNGVDLGWGQRAEKSFFFEEPRTLYPEVHPPRPRAENCRDYDIPTHALKPGPNVFGFWTKPFRAVYITDVELGLDYPVRA
jgi:hypothetical protein